MPHARYITVMNAFNVNSRLSNPDGQRFYSGQIKNEISSDRGW